MRILQTPVRFYPYTGGVENYVLNLSRELVKAGCEVVVMCAAEGGSPGRETIDGIEVIRVRYTGKIANTNLTPSLPIRMLGERFDLIHAHLPTPWSADWSAVVAGMRKKPLVLTYHNDVVGEGFADVVARIYNASALRHLLGTASKIIVTQPKNVERLRYLRNYISKIAFVPVGVDTHRFKPLDVERRNNTLFFLSVLDEYHRYKGLDSLLEAVVAVRRRIPDIRLLVGGSGELLDYYRRRAKTLGLERNVEFLGYVPEDTLPFLYNSCSALVLPSIDPSQEGFGIVALEAMACNTPVIVSEITGVAEDVRELRCGEVVELADGEEYVMRLANAIIRVMEKRKWWRFSRVVRDRYGWSRIARRILEIYEEIGG